MLLTALNFIFPLVERFAYVKKPVSVTILASDLGSHVTQLVEGDLQVVKEVLLLLVEAV